MARLLDEVSKDGSWTHHHPDSGSSVAV